MGSRAGWANLPREPWRETLLFGVVPQSFYTDTLQSSSRRCEHFRKKSATISTDSPSQFGRTQVSTNRAASRSALRNYSLFRRTNVEACVTCLICEALGSCLCICWFIYDTSM